jgi:hypothetical protein
MNLVWEELEAHISLNQPQKVLLLLLLLLLLLSDTPLQPSSLPTHLIRRKNGVDGR